MMAGEPYRQRMLWMLFIDQLRRPVGPVVNIEDLPDGPYGVPPHDLVGWCNDLLEGPGSGTSVAFLMTRPGGDPWTVSDRAWGRFLIGVADELDAPGWPVHWGHRYLLEPVQL